MQTQPHAQSRPSSHHLADFNSLSTRHQYLVFCRRANEITRRGGCFQMSWSANPIDEAGWRREFVAALFRRIDTKAGIVHRGRKRKDSYQVGLARDARRLRDIHNHIRVYQFETPEITKKFGHLLSHYAD